MIALTQSALSHRPGFTGMAPRAAAGLTLNLTISSEAAPRRDAAPAPQARRFAAALEGLVNDGAPLRRPLDRARNAARAFAQGDCFLPGQIIDRSI